MHTNTQMGPCKCRNSHTRAYGALPRVPRPGGRNHRKPLALGERAAAECANDGIARALKRGWRGSQKSPAGEVLSCRGSLKTATPRAAPGSRPPSSRARIGNRRAPPSAKRDGRRILRRWDRTGEVRALHRAAASGQAPTAARAIRLQRPQASVQRAWRARGQRHAVRGGEGGSAPETAREDVIRAAQPSAEAGPPAREEVLDGIAHLRACVERYKCQSGSAHGRVGGRVWFEAPETHHRARRGRPTRGACQGWVGGSKGTRTPDLQSTLEALAPASGPCSESG